MTAVAFDQQAAEAANYVVVDLDELGGGVAGTEVVAPATQDRVDIRDHITDIVTRPAASRLGPDLRPEALHRPLGRPALKVVAAHAAFQHPARHAGSEVAAEEIEALSTLSEVNHSRLLRMQLQPETGQDVLSQPQ